jgi:hypothetical protein
MKMPDPITDPTIALYAVAGPRTRGKIGRSAFGRSVDIRACSQEKEIMRDGDCG